MDWKSMAAVGLEVTTDGIGTGRGTERDGGREFQILGAVNIPERGAGEDRVIVRVRITIRVTV